MGVETLAKGLALLGGERLSVLSYNLLAPLYVRPLDSRTGQVQDFAAFEWAEPASEVLAWEVRQPKLLEELRSSKADIICLQEVQFESQELSRGGSEVPPAAGSDGAVGLTADGTKSESVKTNGAEVQGSGLTAEIFSLPRWLRLEGYAAKIPAQDSLEEMADRNQRVLGLRAPVGNALLYRTDRLELVSAEPGASDVTTRVGAYLRGREESELKGLGEVAVFSVHLDATSEEKRVSWTHNRQFFTAIVSCFRPHKFFLFYSLGRVLHCHAIPQQ